MFDFAFVDLCLHLEYHMQRCRIGSGVHQIGTKNKPKRKQQQMYKPSMEQFLTPISSSYEV